MSKPHHTPQGFARFYAPLAATSLLLTATHPLITAALARTPDPVSALVGFSVAFSVCGVLYSPLLVLQQVVASRLLKGGDFAPIQRFGLLAGVGFSLLAALVAFVDPIHMAVFRDLVGLRGSALAEAGFAFSWLWPIPVITAIRALHQGRLVAGHRTHPIAIATGVRTGVLAIVAIALASTSGGARVGAAAFTAGVMAEALLVLLAPTPALPRRYAVRGGNGDTLVRFSAPLMLNMLLWWSTPLIINTVLARTPSPDLSIAAFAIVEAIAWFLASPVGQLQQASIALVDDEESFVTVRRYSGVLSLATFVMIGLLVLPGVRTALLNAVYDPSPSLLAAAVQALPFVVVYPLLYGHRQFFQGLFVRSGHPWTVGFGAILRIFTIVVLAAFTVGRFGHHGAAFGVVIAAIGLLVEGIFLDRRCGSRAIEDLRTQEPPIAAEAIST